MDIRSSAQPAWRLDFVAVLVTAIILISVWPTGALFVKATTDLVAAYCAVQIMRARSEKR
jgi:hypothetical protein